MFEALSTALEERFTDAHAVASATGVVLDLVHDGAAYRARLTTGPTAAVAVGIAAVDGFELRLRWADRWTADQGPRAPSFDDSFLIDTNDLALATMWLDHTARGGLLASRYAAARQPDRHTALMLRDANWAFEVAGDEVRAQKHDAEDNPERMGDVLMATLLLAGWPVRWARAFGGVGRELGGEPASRVEIGGKPLLRVRRGPVDVRVQLLRRLGPADPGRLRTLVGAHRVGSGGETLSLVADASPRAVRPPPAGPSSSTLSIDARAADLLDLARPSATTVRAHDVEIAFDGPLLDRDRLGAAIELASYWASAAHQSGPYR